MKDEIIEEIANIKEEKGSNSDISELYRRL